MARLIIVPQYPSRMRYQEWWPKHLREGYRRYFDEVLLLMPLNCEMQQSAADFAPMYDATVFELRQIEMYLSLDIDTQNDVLLLCDLSFPGLFSQVLYHRRPLHNFAICHATSLNKLDYFSGDRGSKWLTELATSRLFDGVFVATEYHKKKLEMMENTHVVRFPHPEHDLIWSERRVRKLSSVARPHPQKVNRNLEGWLQDRTGYRIHRFCDEFPRGTWEDYHQFLAESEFLIITSSEETYGYQVVDALMYGVMPLVPRICSYPELLPVELLYDPNDPQTLLDAIEFLERMPIHPELWEDVFVEETGTLMRGCL